MTLKAPNFPYLPTNVPARAYLARVGVSGSAFGLTVTLPDLADRVLFISDLRGCLQVNGNPNGGWYVIQINPASGPPQVAILPTCGSYPSGGGTGNTFITFGYNLSAPVPILEIDPEFRVFGADDGGTINFISMIATVSGFTISRSELEQVETVWDFGVNVVS